MKNKDTFTGEFTPETPDELEVEQQLDRIKALKDEAWRLHKTLTALGIEMTVKSAEDASIMQKHTDELTDLSGLNPGTKEYERLRWDLWCIVVDR